jgi:hypothetical protein
LVTDSQGRPSLYVTQESLAQFKKLLLPILQEGLANIPLPSISGSNDTYDWRLENIVFDSRGLLPERFHLRFVSDLDLDSHSVENKFFTEIHLKMTDIDMAFKNIKFYYYRKSIPSIEDSGIANCFIYGLKFALVWQLISEQDKPIQFKLKEIMTYISDLNIEVIKSEHSIIDSIVTTFFPGYIKHQVTDSLIGAIRNTLEPFTNQLNEYLKKEKEEWSKSLSETWEAAEQKFSNFISSPKENIQELKEKGQEKIKETSSSFNQWFDEKIDWHSHWKSSD